MGLNKLTAVIESHHYKLGPEKGTNMNDSIKPTRDPTEGEEVTILEDSQHAAFIKMLGWRIVPMIEVPADGNQKPDPSARVNFWVYGSRELLKRSLQRYYDNEPFPIQDFCRHLKDIKSQMYALRRMKN